MKSKIFFAIAITAMLSISAFNHASCPDCTVLTIAGDAFNNYSFSMSGTGNCDANGWRNPNEYFE